MISKHSGRNALGSNLWPVLFLALILVYVISLIVMPIVYDTMHLPDTLFMLNSGWRVTQGLRPGIDYDSFYPGLTSRYLAISYWLFGFNVRALDLTVLLQFATLLPLACMAMIGRTSRLTVSAMAAVLATTLLTRFPLEEFTAVTELSSAHSFSYNRLGLALCLVPLIAVLMPLGTRRQEGIAGLAAGVAMAMALMCKWSFVAVLPPVMIALVLQRRWPLFVTTLIGFGLAALVLDPTGQKFLGTFSYVMAASSSEGMGGIGGLLFKTQRILLNHIFVIISLIAALVWALRVLPAAGWSWGVSALVMTGGLGAACVVMGPPGLVGHQILPVAATLLLICAEQMRRHESEYYLVIGSLAVIVTLGFVLPHAGNAALVTAAAFDNRQDKLIFEGPMTGYVQRHETPAVGQPIDQINENIASRIARNGGITRALEYPVFADGLVALQSLSPQGQHGIITEDKYNYEFALSAPPVTDHPLWPRVTSPEFVGQTRISEQADIVMVLREGGTPLGVLLRDWMGQDFEPCLQTPIWIIYTRTGSEITGCASPLAIGQF